MPIAIVLLIVAVIFLVWKLSDILGTQQGHVPTFSNARGKDEGRPAEAQFEGKSSQMSTTPTIRDDMIVETADAEQVKSSLADITAADPTFEPGQFLNGAKAAFDMIMTAFAKGDRDTLSGLVSKEVFSAFDTAIRMREEQSQTLNFIIFEEPKVRFESAEFDRDMAYVGVQIESLQSSAVENEDGDVVSGNADRPESVVNHWVFSRQTTSGNPNWTLIQTAA